MQLLDAIELLTQANKTAREVLATGMMPRIMEEEMIKYYAAIDLLVAYAQDHEDLKKI